MPDHPCEGDRGQVLEEGPDRLHADRQALLLSPSGIAVEGRLATRGDASPAELRSEIARLAVHVERTLAPVRLGRMREGGRAEGGAQDDVEMPEEIGPLPAQSVLGVEVAEPVMRRDRRPRHVCAGVPAGDDGVKQRLVGLPHAR